jgi:hypothetical protein
VSPRKVFFIQETVFAEMGSPAPRPVTRVAAVAVIANPFAGRFVEDLSPLFDLGLQLGEELMPRAAALLAAPALVYGKAAIVGVNGDLEHAAAVLHPKLGRPMRAASGGGAALIPSTTKVGAAGQTLDVPLANKDNPWSFDELDTMTLCVADAPRPDEILVVMVIADGGRPHPRVGKGRAVT